MNFIDAREAILQFQVFLHGQVTSHPETGQPNHLFVKQDETRMSSFRPQGIIVKNDNASLQAFFTKYFKELKRYSNHTTILFKASKKAEGPFTEELLKVKRILIWGNVKTEEMHPMLCLYQNTPSEILALFKTQESQWAEMHSEISWNDFFILCKYLDKKPNFYLVVYLALSFKDPNIQTLVKFQKYLKEFAIVHEAPRLIRALAARIKRQPDRIITAAAQLIMENEPKWTNLLNDHTQCFKADYKTKILYKNAYTDDNWGERTECYIPVYSPHTQIDCSQTVSLRTAKKWPSCYIGCSAFTNEYLAVEFKIFRNLPKHLQENGFRLIKKAQEKGYLSKGDKHSDFTRTDLMMLYFLFHSTGLFPKETFFVEKTNQFQVEPENANITLGNAYRAYIEYDLPLYWTFFERMVESGEMILWEKSNLKDPKKINIEVVDPLLLTMEKLEKSVNWIDSLFFMEKVHKLAFINAENK